jgi:ribonucleoside-diphosphate reductase alpha chain
MRPYGETHWHQTADRAVQYPMDALAKRAGRGYTRETGELRGLTRDRFFIPGGRYLYSCGRPYHQVQNCLLLDVDDAREGWSDLKWKTMQSLLTGAGIGVYYGKLRAGGTLVKRTGGVASGPLPLAISVNEDGRAAVQGGDRRSAIWGGLPWNHPDVDKWITAKDWPDYLVQAKLEDPSVPAPLDMTNISVCLDDEFFLAYDDNTHPLHARAREVYWKAVAHMVRTGEPGFSVDVGEHADEKLRNACTEIVSADDSDICNLGGVVLPRFDSPAEFERAVRLGVLYLTAGTVYSDVPYERVDEIREKNRRLGLDIIGVHEFCLRHGVAYGSDDAFEVLDPYMRAYERALEFAWDWQDEANLSRSVAATSGAPTGTRGIAAESTTGWEPVTAVAYTRQVITSKAHERDQRDIHYVIDPTVARLIEQGVLHRGDPVDDSFTLASDYERRFRMQAYAQSHTDQAISMTVNLEHVMTDPQEIQSFGDTLYKYLPQLRGITVYPNGARAGQPITPVSLDEALAASDVQVEETEEKCVAGACGI